MEIITKGLPNNDQVLLDEVTMTYVQNPDCTEDREGDWQRITLSIRDNGVAKFLNMNANNWSFDNTNDIVQIIEDFKKRINYD